MTNANGTNQALLSLTQIVSTAECSNKISWQSFNREWALTAFFVGAAISLAPACLIEILYLEEHAFGWWQIPAMLAPMLIVVTALWAWHRKTFAAWRESASIRRQYEETTARVGNFNYRLVALQKLARADQSKPINEAVVRQYAAEHAEVSVLQAELEHEASLRMLEDSTKSGDGNMRLKALKRLAHDDLTGPNKEAFKRQYAAALAEATALQAKHDRETSLRMLEAGIAGSKRANFETTQDVSDLLLVCDERFRVEDEKVQQILAEDPRDDVEAQFLQLEEEERKA